MLSTDRIQSIVQGCFAFVLLVCVLTLTACDSQGTLGTELGDAPSSDANPQAGVQPILNPETGNYYAAFADGGITWYEAEEAAAAMKYRSCTGHLATITSDQENAFIAATFPAATTGYWIGGIQTPGSAEPAAGWGWITDESFGYTNWNPGEPNNAANTQTENVIQFAGSGGWNDIRGSNVGANNGYVVEYDCADRGTVIEKPAFNPETGNYYAAFADGGRPWSEAEAAAAAMKYRSCTGHLATITSAQENAFIVANFPEAMSGGYWFGGIQETGSGTPDAGWTWVTGEAFGYTNWNGGEPNDADGIENGAENVMHFAPSGGWNDNGDGANLQFVSGYVVEYACAE